MRQRSGIFITNLDELVLNCSEVEKPRNAGEAGVLLTDFQFDKNHTLILENLNASSAARALRVWSYNRVEQHNAALGKIISESPGESYEIFVKLSDELFSLVEDSVVESILRSDEFSALSVRNGPKDRVYKYGKKLARKAAERPQLVYEAGRFWDGGFDKYYPIIIPGMLHSEEHVQKARQDWNPERIQILDQYLAQVQSLRI